MRPPFRYLLLALGGPLGFLAGHALTQGPDNSAESARAKAVTIESGTPGMITGALEGSSMIAEWGRLNVAEGSGDFAGLYTKIKDTEDPFRRRAFRAAALADWVGRDPKTALRYLREKDKGMVPQFLREWMRTDPNAAIDQLLADGPSATGELSALLEDIVKVAPKRLAEICAKAPPVTAQLAKGKSMAVALNPENAFDLFASRDLEAARAAAESLTGKMRDRALAGIAGAWAEKDGPAALAWAQSLPPGEGRDTVLQRVLARWAKTDPFAALGKLDLLPQASGQGNSQSNVVSRVLGEAAMKDWSATLSWLRDHPERSGKDVQQGLSGAFMRRLRDDPIPVMRDALPNEGLLGDVFRSAVGGEAYAQHDAIWAWLKDQPTNPAVENLRYNLLQAVGYKEPSVALEMLRNYPDSEESRSVFNGVADSIFNNGNGLSVAKLEEWLEKAPPGMRPYLMESGLSHFSVEIGADAERWVSRLEGMPRDRRAEFASNLAGSWAASNPTAASKWALSLSDPEERQEAFTAVAGNWAENDSDELAKVLEAMPRGKDRDLGTEALAQSLGKSAPDAAWSWAEEIQDEEVRRSAFLSIYGYHVVWNPEAAEALLESAHLPEAQLKQFQEYRKIGAERRKKLRN